MFIPLDPYKPSARQIAVEMKLLEVQKRAAENEFKYHQIMHASYKAAYEVLKDELKYWMTEAKTPVVRLHLTEPFSPGVKQLTVTKEIRCDGCEAILERRKARD